jgi:tetratricopeptide (TPR) repeat protein
MRGISTVMRDPAPTKKSLTVMLRGWTRFLRRESERPIEGGWIEPHLLIMGVLFVGAIAIGIIVLPGENERIAALERDGQTNQAKSILEARFAAGDRNQRTLFHLQRFYDYYGQTDKSRNILELLAEQRPKDASIQRQLAQLYKSIQDEPAYIRTLRAQLALKYSEPACKELIGLLRRSSDYAGEQKALIDCRERGYRRPDDLIRLAFLEASDGKMASAAQILRAVDDRRWLRLSRERQLLFSALLESQQLNEALRRAVRWLKGQPDAEMAIDLVYKLVEVNRNDMALQLARDVGEPGDSVTLAVGEIMVDQVQYGAARAFLTGWLEQNKTMNLELATRFINAAIDAEDPLLALRGGERFGLKKLEEAEVVGLAEVLSVTSYGADFDRVRLAVDADTLARNPMLSAGVELRQGRTEMARAYLVRVRVDQLSARRIILFSQLVEQAGRPPALAAVLREIQEPRSSIIPANPVVPRATVLGPAQSQVKQRILSRAEANKRLRERRKVTQTKQALPPQPGPKGFGTSPFAFPFPQ